MHLQQKPFFYLLVFILVAGSTLAGQGFSVQAVKPGSQAETQGLEVGDVLLAWKGASPEGQTNELKFQALDHAYALEYVSHTQRPLGAMVFQVRRDGDLFPVTLPADTWGVSLRPVMADPVAALYQSSRKSLENKDLDAWEELTIKAADKALSSGDPMLGQWLLVEGAVDMMRVPDLVRSQLLMDRALDNGAALNDPFVQAYTLENQSIIQELAGQYTQANLTLAKALKALTEKDQQGLCAARLYLRLGLNEYFQSQYDQAEGYWQTCLNLRQQYAPLSMITSEPIHNLGTLARMNGDLRRAEELLTLSLLVTEEKQPGTLDHSLSLYGLAMLAMKRGNLIQAEQLSLEALAIQEKVATDRREYGFTFNALGSIYHKRGDLELAKTYYQKSLEVFERTDPSRIKVASALDTLATVAAELGDLEQAVAWEKQALAIFEEVNPGEDEVLDLYANLAIMKQLGGDPDGAFQDLLLVLKEMVERFPNHYNRKDILISLSRYALETERPDQALHFAQSAVAFIEEKYPHDLELASALHALAMAYWENRELDLAEKNFIRCIEHFEKGLEISAARPESRASMTRDFAYYYKAYFQFLLKERQDSAQLFHLLESARAQQMLALMAERDLAAPKDVPPDLLKERNALAASYEGLQDYLGSLALEGKQEEIRDLLAEQVSMREQMSLIRQKIIQASPRWQKLNFPQPLSLEKAQGVLDKDTLFLSYLFFEDQLYLLALGPGESDLKTFTLAMSHTQVEQKTRQVLGQIGKQINAGDGLEELGAALLSPVADQLHKAERILIVPDQVLHFVPWAALTLAGKPLAEINPVHNTPSLTVYQQLQELESRVPLNILAVGDPHYPTSLANFDLEENQVLRSMTRRGQSLPSLPGSRLELLAIKKIFPEKTTLLMGQNATEENVKEAAPKASHLHFAVHGLVDDQLPLDSALVLSLAKERGAKKDNGFLQAWEILEHLSLNADLVVLSACETGLGEDLGGEGIVGLSSAFLYAGARSIVASLWPISDVGTVYFMERFYRHLKKGQSKARALQSAQQDMMKRRRYAHPYYWAGFFLMGDPN